MNRIIIAAAFGCFATAFAADRMDRSKFLIGAYSFKAAASDEAHIREIKECGVDFIVGVSVTDRTALDLFAKYGLGAIGSGALPGWWGGNGSNAGMMREQRPWGMYENKIAQFNAELDHPALWKVALCDEPSALDMKYLGEVAALMEERMPQCPAYMNLYPNYASYAKNTGAQTRNQLGTATYREHIETYCRTVPLDYISYDFYVYANNPKRRKSLYRQMYENFDIVADACRRTGRSFWYIPQVNSYKGKNFEPTTKNRLRFQAHTAMAYGAEVVSWACWMPGWWTNNVLTATGEKTEQYDRLKTVNAELRRIAPLYMKYRSVDTHLVGFGQEDGIAETGIPVKDVLDTGFFSDVETFEGTPLVVGEMTPRNPDDMSRALFVVAAGDPYDYAPAVRTVMFRTPQGRKAEVYGCDGLVPTVTEADGVQTFRLAENAAVMIVSRPCR